MALSQQAKNSISLYYRGNPQTIKKLLLMQSPSVVEELKQFIGVDTIDQLARRLAMGF